MKIVKFLTVAVAVLGFCSLPLFVQAQDSLPIYSSAALRAYALSQARGATVQASSGTGNSGFQDYYWDAPKNSTDILALINETKLSFDTTDTSAMAYLYVIITDKQGNMLFSGSSSGKPVQESGKWIMPTSVGTISIELTGDVRILTSKAVSFAYVIDSKGYSHKVPSYDDGTLFFPKVSAGLPGGKLKIWYQDGTTETFSTDPKDMGKVIPIVAVSASVMNSSIKDVLAFKDPEKVTVSILAINKKGIIPTIEVTRSDTSGATSFDIATSDGKRPTKLWFRLNTSEEWGSVDTGVSWPVSITIPVGTSYFVPEFNSVDFSEETKTVDYGNGNSGKG